MTVVVKRFRVETGSGGSGICASGGSGETSSGAGNDTTVMLSIRGKRFAGLPTFITDSIAEALFVSLSHEQLSVREHAVLAFAAYLSRCSAALMRETMLDVLRRLNTTAPSSPDTRGPHCVKRTCVMVRKTEGGEEVVLLGDYEAEGLLSVCESLVPLLDDIFSLSNWVHISEVLRPYLCHPASTVRQKTSSILNRMLSTSFATSTAVDASLLRPAVLMRVLLQSLVGEWQIHEWGPHLLNPQQSSTVLTSSSMDRLVTDVEAPVHMSIPPSFPDSTPSLECTRKPPSAIDGSRGDNTSSTTRPVVFSWEWREGRLLTYELLLERLGGKLTSFLHGNVTTSSSSCSSSNPDNFPTPTLPLAAGLSALSIQVETSSPLIPCCFQHTSKWSPLFVPVPASQFPSEEHRYPPTLAASVALSLGEQQDRNGMSFSVLEAHIHNSASLPPTCEQVSTLVKSLAVPRRCLPCAFSELEKTYSFPPIRNLLFDMLRHTFVCTFEVRWELRRMADQIWPQLSRTLIMFDTQFVSSVCESGMRSDSTSDQTLSILLLKNCMLSLVNMAEEWGISSESVGNHRSDDPECKDNGRMGTKHDQVLGRGRVDVCSLLSTSDLPLDIQEKVRSLDGSSARLPKSPTRPATSTAAAFVRQCSSVFVNILTEMMPRLLDIAGKCMDGRIRCLVAEIVTLSLVCPVFNTYSSRAKQSPARYTQGFAKRGSSRKDKQVRNDAQVAPMCRRELVHVFGTLQTIQSGVLDAEGQGDRTEAGRWTRVQHWMLSTLRSHLVELALTMTVSESAVLIRLLTGFVPRIVDSEVRSTVLDAVLVLAFRLVSSPQKGQGRLNQSASDQHVPLSAADVLEETLITASLVECVGDIGAFLCQARGAEDVDGHELKQLRMILCASCFVANDETASVLSAVLQGTGNALLHFNSKASLQIKLVPRSSDRAVSASSSSMSLGLRSVDGSGSNDGEKRRPRVSKLLLSMRSNDIVPSPRPSEISPILPVSPVPVEVLHTGLPRNSPSAESLRRLNDRLSDPAEGKGLGLGTAHIHSHLGAANLGTPLSRPHSARSALPIRRSSSVGSTTSSHSSRFSSVHYRADSLNSSLTSIEAAAVAKGSSCEGDANLKMLQSFENLPLTASSDSIPSKVYAGASLGSTTEAFDESKMTTSATGDDGGDDGGDVAGGDHDGDGNGSDWDDWDDWDDEDEDEEDERLPQGVFRVSGEFRHLLDDLRRPLGNTMLDLHSATATFPPIVRDALLWLEEQALS